MQITKKTITVRDLCQNYRDDNVFVNLNVSHF